MVAATGLEPVTYWLEASHSIQLSYAALCLLRIGFFQDKDFIIGIAISKTPIP
jgi:hypothetical protein